MTTGRKALALGLLGGLVAIAAYVVFAGRQPTAVVMPASGCVPIAGATGPVPAVPCTRVARLVGEMPGYVAPGGPPDGSVVGDARSTWHVPIVVLGDSVITGGVPWIRVYVPSYQSGGGNNDLFTWLPISVNGEVRIVEITEPECPPTRDNLSTLGALDAFTLARCLGSGMFTVTGATGTQVRPVAHDVTPDWLSGWHRQDASFSIRAEPFGEPIDVQVRDGNLPPRGFSIELTAHVADPAATGCVRKPIYEDFPAETREDSILWCTTRVVADAWTALRGPEGRPIDPTKPQLHRHQPFDACAGVNGGVMRFRLDAMALDPVWLEGRRGGRSLPSFTDEFRPAFQPDFVIVDGSGRVVIRDGLEVDTNGNLAGHFICPTGLAVYFN